MLKKGYVAKLEDLVVGATVLSPKSDDFAFLDQTGRKLFWGQGYKGQNVIVAVVDSGVNANHPELKGRVLPGKNFVDNTPVTADFDIYGHGTHVSATIAGQLMCGIAPQAKILPVKVLDDTGILWTSYIVFDALDYIYNWRGANGEKVDIVNMSFGGNGWTETEKAILKDKVKKLNSIGISVIVAAGNSGREETQFYPAALEEVITVGAVDMKKQIAYFSTTGNMVDLCQMGVDIISADTNSSDYIKMSGTSMACPMVAGIAALMICKDKILNGEYNKAMSGDALELSYYKQLRNASTDLGVAGTDKIYGTGFCTLSQKILTELKFWQGKTDLYVNGVYIKMDAPITTVNNRALIAIKYVSDALGGAITYTSATDPIITLL